MPLHARSSQPAAPAGRSAHARPASPAPLPAKNGRQVSTGPAALMRMEEIHRRIRAVMRDPTGRTRVTAKGLAREWNVAINTVRDAIFLLEVFRAPIARDERRKTLYYTHPHWELRPPLFLESRQLLSLLVAIRVASHSRTFPLGADLVGALRQIAPMLAGAASFGPETLDPVFSTADVIAGAAEANHFALLCDAITQRRAVRVAYRKARPDAADEPRILYPLHWFIRHDACLLIAHDPASGGRRTFKLTRLQDVQLTDEVFAWPAGFDLKRYLSGAFGEFLGEPAHAVRVRFEREYVPLLREHEWQGGQVLVEQPDGGAEVTFHVCHTAALEHYVLRAGGLAEVISPPEVRARVHAAAARLLARHAPATERGVEPKPAKETKTTKATRIPLSPA